MRITLYVFATLIATLLAYVSWAAWRAHRGLVTLDVRDMEIRQVVKKMEWQTWEDIFVHQEVQGKVTLKVHNLPLAQALRMAGDQIFARSSLLYPLYAKSDSFTRLKKSLRGEMDPNVNGWTNLLGRAQFDGPGFGGFGGPGGGIFMRGQPGQTGQPQPASQLVSLNISAKDLDFTALAMSRFAQARLVPEDGANATVSVIIQEASVSKAVAKIANAAHLKWSKVYALQAGFGGPRGPGGGPQFTQRDNQRDSNAPAFFARGPEMTEEQREEQRKKRDALEEELKSVLPTAERQKLDAAQAEREKQMAEMANMTDEERRNRMMSMMGPNINRMNQDRILNNTPEQRAEMNRRMNQMRGGPGGGPGGGAPGGPGR